ncbi:hypothetical protein MKX07_007233 [Trichoderma sp. CBMAI-0711]|nr:hypothetical protein MKX07_007233 [Trichoderma sp. CBMAI-0711]
MPVQAVPWQQSGTRKSWNGRKRRIGAAGEGLPGAQDGWRCGARGRQMEEEEEEEKEEEEEEEQRQAGEKQMERR